MTDEAILEKSAKVTPKVTAKSKDTATLIFAQWAVRFSLDQGN